jgi:hypothetical protein
MLSMLAYFLRDSQKLPRDSYTSLCSSHESMFSERRQTSRTGWSLSRNILERITNCRLQDAARLQATLPVRSGGIGVRRTVKLALPAFLASVHSVHDAIFALAPRSVDLSVVDALNQWTTADSSNSHWLRNNQTTLLGSSSLSTTYAQSSSESSFWVPPMRGGRNLA